MTHYACTCSTLSPFRWAERTDDTIFSRDIHYVPKGKQGLSMSEIQSATITRRTAQEGRNPGTIINLSPKADRLLAQSETHQRRRKSTGFNHMNTAGAR